MALQTSNSNKAAEIQTDLIDFTDHQTTSLLDDNDQQDEMKWPPSPGSIGYAKLTTIEKIIPEIVLAVFEFLRDADVVALALASKTMFLKYLPRARLTPPERKQLLLRLEKELPQMYYCHGCVKLHRWHLSWYDMYKDEEVCLADQPSSRMRNCDKYTWTMHHCPRTAPFVIPGRYAIPYHLARPIMNRDRYGPAHGPPEEVLDRSTKSAGKVNMIYGDISRGIVERNLHTVRVRDGQLIVYSAVSLYEQTQDQWKLLRYLNHIGVSVCKHLATRHAAQCETMYEFNATGSPEVFSRAAPTTKSCYKCMTDYSIQVESKDARGWVVTIRSWQSLGSVLSPLTWDWKHMTLDQAAINSGTVEPRFKESKRDQKHSPGMVRSTYYSFDTVRGIPEGLFYPQRCLKILEIRLLANGHGPRSRVRPRVKPSLSIEDGDEDVDM